jgi:hypothetical protein
MGVCMCEPFTVLHELVVQLVGHLCIKVRMTVVNREDHDDHGEQGREKAEGRGKNGNRDKKLLEGKERGTCFRPPRVRVSFLDNATPLLGGRGGWDHVPVCVCVCVCVYVRVCVCVGGTTSLVQISAY